MKSVLHVLVTLSYVLYTVSVETNPNPCSEGYFGYFKAFDICLQKYAKADGDEGRFKECKFQLIGKAKETDEEVCHKNRKIVQNWINCIKKDVYSGVKFPKNKDIEECLKEHGGITIKPE